MSLHQEWVTFEEGGQIYKLYTAKQKLAKGPLPAVIVIQEIWGTDEHIQDVTDRYAKAGYFAVAPDLFSENGERPAALVQERIEQVKSFLNTLPPTAWHNPEEREQILSLQPEPQRTEIKETYTAVFGALAKMPEFVKALQATVRYLNENPNSQGQKVGSVGFCMGGALSSMLATTGAPSLAGAVMYYGRFPEKDALAGIQCPVLGFFGELDKAITDNVPDFANAMEAAGKNFTYEVYPGAQHAFFNDTRPSYQVEAARDAWSKTIRFFREVLV